MINVCSMCKQECFSWEISGCSKCQHIIAVKSIKRVEDSVRQLFARNGINYDEFKANLAGELI